MGEKPFALPLWNPQPSVLPVHLATTFAPLVISVHSLGWKFKQIRERGYEIMDVEKDALK